jgi:hypothetical protein
MTFSLRIIVLCCTVALAVGPGCRGAASSHGPYREFAFSVDSTRLGVEAYRSAHPGLDVQEEWLLLGGIHAVQLLGMDTLRVQFKFLVESDPVVGLDYSVPHAAWEQEVRAVESSLGTIRRL